MHRNRMPHARRKARPRIELLEGRQLLATFSVTSIADSGPNTLRDAIIQANALSGTDTIAFNIAGAGVHTIIPVSPLPDITDPAILDATNQPGYSGTPLIELNGSNILDGATPPAPIPGVRGLSLTAGASTIRGFAINRFTGFGITASGDANLIASNFVGTDTSGLTSLRNVSGGISLSSRNNTIGGTAASDRNLISGNGGPGLFLGGPGNAQITNNLVRGNFIGTTLSGTSDLGNTGDGVELASAGNQIGGDFPNVIAFNGRAGVRVDILPPLAAYPSNTISKNSIFSNGDLGIAYPVLISVENIRPTITSASIVPGGTQVEGTINAFNAAPTTYTLEFFSNLVADPSGFGEGQVYRGTATVTTNAQGIGTFSVLLPSAIPLGQFVTATATTTNGTTHDFSNAISVGSMAVADLTINGFATSFQGQTGQSLTYIFNVTNNGPSRSVNTIVHDALPVGANFVSASSTQGTVPTGVVNGVATFNLGPLNSGQTVQITLTVQPTQAGTAVNVATVSDPIDSNTVNNQSTIFTTIVATPPADLAILGASSPNPASVGGELTYLFVVQNTSFRAGATGVVVTDILPPGLTFLRARTSQGSFTEVNGTITANLGTIPAAANATVTIIVRPTAAGLIANAASVRSNEADPDSTNNDVVVNTVVNAAPPADLGISLTASPQPAQVGREFTYAVLVVNRGPAPATGVTVRDFLPAGAAVVSIKPSQGTANIGDGIVTANLGNLPAGATAVLTIVLRPGAAGLLESRADVTADQPDFLVSDNVSLLNVIAVGDATPPTIIDQKLIVARKSISAIVVTFSQAIDPISAANVDNYRVRDLGKNPNLPAKDGKEIAIRSAIYDPNTRSVRLIPAHALKIGTYYKLVVNGPGAPGIANTSGVVLDGDRNRLPDGIYESLIGRGTHDRPTSLQLGAIKPRPKVKVTPPKHVAKKSPTNINIVVNN